IGRYGHADEPGHQLVYLFNLVGQPWRTEYYVNRIEREMYTDRPDGIVNNDDLGQMSAWYVLSALGFYPISPGDFIYQIGTPSFRGARIDLGAGKSFVITADNVSDANIYIQSATLNGMPYRHSYLTHGEIMAGGTLHLVMGPAPAKDWGSRPEDTSLGEFDEKERVTIPHRASWAPYDPEPGSHFGEAKLVRLVSKEPGASIRYTRDGTRPGATSPIYSGPIRITRDTLLKAVAFAPNLRPSSIFSKQYRRTADADLRSGYPKIQLEQKDIGYGRADGSMMIDEVEGTKFYGDHKWTGRQGDITATIDLGEKRKVRAISVGYLNDPMNGILPPRLIEVWGGNKPGEFRRLNARKVFASAGIQQEREEVALELEGTPSRYFKVHMVSWGAMPREISAGKTAWLFVDEVLFR
ncbi:MAG TPA: glycoside hydrolase domain-containing protein, partial [Sphingomicrobium sp.]|nr:glycoside hydrolase domain-containing protein [Sphingomicrobium sp.]